jgi:hypothetical protein
MKRYSIIAFISLALLLNSKAVLAGVPYLQDQMSSEEALELALKHIEKYGVLSVLIDDDKVDISDDFKALFALNAVIPLDFIDSKESELVSPEKYVAEYFSREIGTGIPVVIRVLSSKNQAFEMGESGDYRVVIYLQKLMYAEVVNEEMAALEKPKRLIQEMEILVSKGGNVRINRLIPVMTTGEKNWSVDIRYAMDISNPIIINDFDQLGSTPSSLNLTTIGLRVNYSFNPFLPISTLGNERVDFMIGLSMDQWTYSMDSGSLSSEEINALPGSQVINLNTGVDISDTKPSARNFVRKIDSDYEKESLKATLAGLSIGLGYDLASNTSSSTRMELGFGFLGGQTKQMTSEVSYSSQTTFAEGPFSSSPVIIRPYDEISYVTAENLAEHEEVSSTYGLQSINDASEYNVEFKSTSYMEIRLVQLFNLGEFDLGGALSLTKQLSSPIDFGLISDRSHSYSVTNGIPRLIALTEKSSPLFLGLGLRIQKQI